MERQAADDHAQKCAAFLSLSTVLSLLMFPANIGHQYWQGDICLTSPCWRRVSIAQLFFTPLLLFMVCPLKEQVTGETPEAAKLSCLWFSSVSDFLLLILWGRPDQVAAGMPAQTAQGTAQVHIYPACPSNMASFQGICPYFTGIYLHVALACCACRLPRNARYSMVLLPWSARYSMACYHVWPSDGLQHAHTCTEVILHPPLHASGRGIPADGRTGLNPVRAMSWCLRTTKISLPYFSLGLRD